MKHSTSLQIGAVAGLLKTESNSLIIIRSHCYHCFTAMWCLEWGFHQTPADISSPPCLPLVRCFQVYEHKETAGETAHNPDKWHPYWTLLHLTIYVQSQKSVSADCNVPLLSSKWWRPPCRRPEFASFHRPWVTKCLLLTLTIRLCSQ